ncbi:hypothetical protein CPB86DRAFT_78280 [Serendipita vermifera]|nr:hypothetical protein CPB86DRAFT_78280 [Serendipita vermifera]
MNGLLLRRGVSTIRKAITTLVSPSVVLKRCLSRVCLQGQDRRMELITSLDSRTCGLVGEWSETSVGFPREARQRYTYSMSSPLLYVQVIALTLA